MAQSFRCDESGAFLSSVDIYFGTKDDSQPVTVQLRTMELGTPTDILAADYAEVIVPSSDITVSNDASVATNIKFPSPIYLDAGTEYALVLLSPGTTKYTVWISRIGDITIETRDLGEGNRIRDINYDKDLDLIILLSERVPSIVTVKNISN